MKALDQLVSVLCDQSGKCCIHGSEADRQIVDDSLATIRAELAIAQPVQPEQKWVGLTKEDVESWELPSLPTVYEFTKFIEAKLKEKNHEQV